MNCLSFNRYYIRAIIKLCRCTHVYVNQEQGHNYRVTVTEETPVYGHAEAITYLEKSLFIIHENFSLSYTVSINTQ